MEHETPFFKPGGTMEPTAPSYLLRDADAQLLKALLAGEYVYLLDSRQKGKSSLVARTIVKLKEQGILTVKLDLQRIGANVTPEQWYAGLMVGIGQELGIAVELIEHWESRKSVGPLARWLGIITEVVLAQSDRRIVTFIDEVDFVRALDFSTDEFFAGIRDCYNRRSEQNGFERLTFCLVGVATPGQLIRNPEITPFNIGTKIELTDFTLDETKSYRQVLEGGGRNGENLMKRVHHWVNGHPYLTQLLCSHIAENRAIASSHDVDRLVRELFFTPEARHTEPNFAAVEQRILDPDVPGLSPEERKTQVLELYGRLLRGKGIEASEENPVVASLQLAGVGHQVHGSLRVRNLVYKTVFNEGWRRQSLPNAELRRQRGAARLAILRTAAVAGVVVLAISSAAVGILKISKERERALMTLSQRTEDLSRVSSGRKVALTDLEKRNLELKQISKEREDALSSLSKSNEDLSKTANERKRAIAMLGQSNNDLKRTSHDKEQALLDIQEGSDELKRLNYALLVSSLHNSKRSVAAERYFKAPRSPYRGWEWGHLGKLFEKPVMETLFPQAGYIEKQTDGSLLAVSVEGLFELSPNGLKLFKRFQPTMRESGSDDTLASPYWRYGSMRIWHSEKDKTFAILDAENHQVIVPYQKNWILDINPKARTYLSWSKQTPDAVEVREMDGNRLIGSHKGPSVARDAYFLPNGSCISAHSDDKTPFSLDIQRWDLSGTTKVVRPALRSFRMFGLSPDKTKYAIFEDRRGEVRRVIDDTVLSVIPEHTDFVQAFEFSPDGRKLLIGYADGAVKLYDSDSAQLLRTFVDQWVIFQVAFLPDGKHCASIGSNLKVWSLESRPAFETFSDDVSTAAYVTVDGKSLISLSVDGTIVSRNLETGNIAKRPVESPGPSGHLARGEDCERAFLGLSGGRVARLFSDTLKEELVRKVFPSGSVKVQVLPGGKRLLVAVVDDANKYLDCAILDARSLVALSHFRLKPSDQKLFSRSFVTSYSLDGSCFAVADFAGTEVNIYSASNGGLVRCIKTDLLIYALDLSPDGNRIAISVSKQIYGAGSRIDLMDTISGKKIGFLKGPGDSIRWLDYSPNGDFLAGTGAKDSGHLWDLRTRKEIATIPRALGSLHMRFSADGERLITSGRFHNIGIWDGRTGAELMILKYYPPNGRIADGAPRIDDARFSSDGRSVVASCNDGGVRIWHSLPWQDQSKAVRK